MTMFVSPTTNRRKSSRLSFFIFEFHATPIFQRTCFSIAFTIAGIGIANLVPIAFSAAGNQPDISSSTGMSIVTTIGYLGTLMAPAPVGLAAELTGFPAVYSTMAAMLGLIFIFAPLVKSRTDEA
ncbi:hypothetical protein [Citrobacter sp. FP75]|uniref:hypothetical protein n=1 Tax=Citrobacter sp. FP75 TaxID=1852949 RepID=UPI001FD10244|nr:hypothetical protein [Citrobacter sp. FP75]